MAVTVRLRYLVLTVLALVAIQGATIPLAVSLAQQGGAPEPAANAPLGTSFTYQGHLTANNAIASGPFDLEFSLFDAPTGGAALQTIPILEDVPVVGGLFSVTLAFDPAHFKGSERYLQVRIKPGTGGSFELLGARQQLTATPYALYAREAGAVDWAAVANKPAGFSDGIDNDTTYAAQSPLDLNGTTFGFSVAGCQAGDIWKYTGASWSCDPDAGGAAGAHDHYGQSWTGSTAPTGLKVTNTAVDGDGIAGAGGLRGAGIVGTASSNAGCAFNPLTELCYGVVGDASTTPNQAGIGIYGEGTNLGLWAKASSIGGSGYSALFEGRVAVRGTNTQEVPAALLYSESTTDDLAAIRGKATGGGDNAIEGVAAGSGGTGVYGESTSATGEGVVGSGATGVLGVGSATGVNGEGPIGVYGRTTLQHGGFRAAVRGDNVGTCNSLSGNVADYCIGVWGRAIDGAATIGVLGQANLVGVQGASQTTGVYGGGGQTGVWGSGSTYGVRSDGPLQVNGNAVVTGTCSCFPSDGRYKHSLQSLPYGLAEVLALEPITYRWSEGRADDKQHAGFVAQDAQAIVPELVLTPESGDLYVDPMAFIALLTRAIQEQQAQIDGIVDAGSGVRDSGAPATVSAAPPIVDRTSGFALAAALFAGLALFAHALRRA